MTKYIWALLHLIAWLVILGFITFSYSVLVPDKWHLALHLFFNAIAFVAVFYFHSKFSITRLLRKNKYWLFALTVVLTIGLFSLVKPFYSEFINNLFDIKFTKKGLSSYNDKVLSNAIIVFFMLLVSTAFQFAEDWFKNEAIRRNLENQKLKAELAFLKSQVNPHFLFNVLNSLYALSIKKSDKAPEVILKLSGMMRYLLEENNNFVPLTKEVDFVSNYLELQKLRLENNVPVAFETEGEITGKEIAPLILIPLVENAFKHGALDDPEAGIHVYLAAPDKQLRFSVFNKISNGEKDQSSGIGLKNVERRLNLLYPNKHSLRFSENEGWYKAELEIELP